MKRTGSIVQYTKQTEERHYNISRFSKEKLSKSVKSSLVPAFFIFPSWIVIPAHTKETPEENSQNPSKEIRHLQSERPRIIPSERRKKLR